VELLELQELRIGRWGMAGVGYMPIAWLRSRLSKAQRKGQELLRALQPSSDLRAKMRSNQAGEIDQ
jgi:hypothetical protein